MLRVEQYLQNLGVSLQVAQNFIFSNLNNLGLIHSVCLQYGVDNDMIAEIVDPTHTSITGNLVAAYLNNNGFNGNALGFEYASEHTVTGSIVSKGADLSSVDKWSFTHRGGSLVIDTLTETDTNGIDIKSDGRTNDHIDIMVRLYDSIGNLIAYNDDSTNGTADGSTHESYLPNIQDSYLSFSNLDAGQYTLAVGSYDLSNEEVIYGTNNNTGDNNTTHPTNDTGVYQITFTGTTNAPVLTALEEHSVTGNIVSKGQDLSSVDKWSFTHRGGSLVIDTLTETDTNGIDIKSDGRTNDHIDIMIRLYDSIGNFVAYNDDSTDGTADGSTSQSNQGHIQDSYLSFSNLAAGQYTLAVGSYDLSNEEVIYGTNNNTGDNNTTHPEHDTGVYQITFIGQASQAELIMA